MHFFTSISVAPVESPEELASNKAIAPDISQKGTVRLKQKQWLTSQPQHSLLIQHYCTEDFSPSPYWGSGNIPNIFNTLKVAHNSIHNVKAYSTIAHTFQNNSIHEVLSPITMNQLPWANVKHIQIILGIMKKILTRSLHFIHNIGICGRLEVSVRPGTDSIGNTLRTQGHLTDFLFHIHVALHDLLISGTHKLKCEIMETELVRDKAHSLIDHTEQLLRIRASTKFSDIFPRKSQHTWLKSMINMIAITIGIAPVYKLKYTREWIKDHNRFDPTGQAQFVLGEFLQVDADRTVIHSIHPTTCIPTSLTNQVSDILSRNGVSEHGITTILAFVTSTGNPTNPQEYIHSLPLEDKIILADICHRILIPQLLHSNATQDISNDPLPHAPKQIDAIQFPQDNESLLYFINTDHDEYGPDRPKT